MQQVLPNLYISSWYTIIASGVLEKEGITHVLSVMRNVATSEVLNPFERMIIDVDDDPDEAILDHFESTNRWIDDALAEGGKVVVHWYGNLKS
jgi:dual specificity phosphatase 12